MGPCYERMLFPHEWTPEKGDEQLARMSACYDRELRFKFISLCVFAVGFLIVLGIVLLGAALRI